MKANSSLCALTLFSMCSKSIEDNYIKQANQSTPINFKRRGFLANFKFKTSKVYMLSNVYYINHICIYPITVYMVKFHYFQIVAKH